MGCPSQVDLGSNLVFSEEIHDPDTAGLTTPDAPPSYRIYSSTGSALLTGTMSQRDGRTGFYEATAAITLGNGFADGQEYEVQIEATVGGITGGVSRPFLCGTSVALKASLITPQQTAREAYGISGVVWHVATNGNDGNDGLSWATAKLTPKTVIEAASANDLVLIGPGIFDMSTDTVVIPTGVAIRGAGIDTTWIQSSHVSGVNNEPMVQLGGNYLTVEDLTIQGTGDTTMPIGTPGSSNTGRIGCVLRRIRTQANWDGLILSDPVGSTVYAFDCIFNGKYDSVATFTGSHDVHLFNCAVNTRGPEISGSNPSDGIWVSSGRVTMYGGSINCQDATIGQRCSAVFIESGEFYGDGVTIRTFMSDASDKSIKIDGGGYAYLTGCDYDRTKTTGSRPVNDIGRIVTSTVGKVTALLAAADVSGNLPVDLQTIKTRAVHDPGSGITVWFATAQYGAANGPPILNSSGVLTNGNWYTGTPPTAGAISTQVAADLLAAHGPGSWQTLNLGGGAYNIQVTVTDGVNPLPDASVRFTKGAETYLGSTSSLGQVSFGLDGGTWNLVITLGGYLFTPTTLTVTADADVAYPMSAVSIPVSNAGFVTAYGHCYIDGTPTAGVEVYMQLMDLPGTAKEGSGIVEMAVTDANGMATFANRFAGGAY